jgi:UrcA family protein
MSNRLIKLLPLAAALAMSSLATAGTTLTAEQPRDLPSVVVKYGDLDLNKGAGIRTLHTRLRAAARKVCSPADGSVLADTHVFDSCVADALARGVNDVNNPNLTQYHRSGRVDARVASN